jgi:glutamate/tyrosine decarboxylase-like PLP-dependent enzyme
MTLQTYGADRLGQIVDASCDVAQHLAARIRHEPALELLAPVALNIVCFRVRAGADADRQNREIVADLQVSGIAAPSTTTIDGKLAIRAAIVNHRTVTADVDAMVDAVLHFAELRQALPLSEGG